MAKILITGSADGLGQLAARSLVEQGHQVVLHARSPGRARQALQQVPGATHALSGDLSRIDETTSVAEQANAWGQFDAVIHNAGVYRAPAIEIFMVNTIAPYLLTCLVHRPGRLVYLGSGMHLQGRANLENFTHQNPRISYSDSKLHVVLLCKAVARKWPHVYANVVDPGWVPTRMGGPSATGDLQKGYETQVWLAEGSDTRTQVSGRCFHHQAERPCSPLAGDAALQEKFLAACRDITGIPFPP